MHLHVQTSRGHATCHDPRVTCRFSQLQQADVTGIEPAVRADIDADSVLRDDVPEECESRYVGMLVRCWPACVHVTCHSVAHAAYRVDLMAEVPDRENAYVKVPKIM